MPQADELMRSVVLGPVSFLDHVAASHQDIQEMQHMLAA